MNKTLIQSLKWWGGKLPRKGIHRPDARQVSATFCRRCCPTSMPGSRRPSPRTGMWASRSSATQDGGIVDGFHRQRAGEAGNVGPYAGGLGSVNGEAAVQSGSTATH